MLHGKGEIEKQDFRKEFQEKKRVGGWPIFI
jgi:hypothetical protein